MIPFFVFKGPAVLMASAGLCGLALFTVGSLISVFTGRSMIFSGLRMLGIGALAALLTYAIGHFFGVSLGG